MMVITLIADTAAAMVTAAVGVTARTARGCWSPAQPQALTSHLQRSCDQEGAIADARPGNFNCIADARDQCVILQKALRTQTDF